MNQPYNPQQDAFGNLDEVNESQFDPVPPGVYLIRAIEMSRNATKKGDGEYVKVQFEIMEGEHAGRKIFDNFNIRNPNSQAVAIALRQIKQWLLAAGHPATGQMDFQRLWALQGHPVWAKIKVEEDKSGRYEPDNSIARFITPDQSAPPATPAAPAAAAPPPAAPPAAAPATPPAAPPAQPAVPPAAAPPPAPAAPPAAPATPAAPAAPAAPATPPGQMPWQQ